MLRGLTVTADTVSWETCAWYNTISTLVLSTGDEKHLQEFWWMFYATSVLTKATLSTSRKLIKLYSNFKKSVVRNSSTKKSWAEKSLDSCSWPVGETKQPLPVRHFSINHNQWAKNSTWSWAMSIHLSQSSCSPLPLGSIPLPLEATTELFTLPPRSNSMELRCCKEANECICHISNGSLYHHSTLAWDLW